MSRHIGVGGAWESQDKNSVEVGGVWKTVIERWIGVSGVWKVYWPDTESSPVIDILVADFLLPSKTTDMNGLRTITRAKTGAFNEDWIVTTYDRTHLEAFGDTLLPSKTTMRVLFRFRAKTGAFTEYWTVTVQDRTHPEVFGDGLLPSKTTTKGGLRTTTRAKVGALTEDWTITTQDRTRPETLSDALAPVKTTVISRVKARTRAKAALLNDGYTTAIHSYNGPSAPPSSITLTDASSCTFGMSAPAYSVLVQWTNGDSAAQTRVYRGGVLVHTAAAGATSWIDTNPGSGLKTYEVRHYKNAIESSGIGGNVTVTVLQCSPTGAPTLLTVQDLSSCSSCVATYVARLSWTNADALAQTRIYRGGVLQNTVGVGVATWDDTSGLTNTTYTWEVRHYRNGVESTGDSEARTLVQPCVMHSPPTLSLTVLGETSIRIQSMAVPDGGYTTVYRAGTSTVVGTLNAGNSFTITDTGRTPGTQYCYEGTTTSSTGCTSARGASACATTSDWPDAPPVSITLTNTSACVFGVTMPAYSVLVQWANGDATAQTRVYRGGALVHTAAAGATSWTDTAPGTGTLTYEVRHYKGGVESTGRSGNVTVTVLQCSPTGAPTLLTVQDLSSCAACVATYVARLAWTNADAAAQTRIYRGGVLQNTVAAGVATWDDTTGLTNASYTWEVRHYRNGVESTGDSEARTLTNPCIVHAAPTLSLTVLGKTSIRISYGIGVPDGGYVTVYRAGTATVVGVLNDANSWQIDDTGRSANTQYCYEGVSTSATGCSSARGASVCATTWPTTPLSFFAMRDSDTQVSLSWDVGTRTGTSMTIERRDGVGQPWVAKNYPTAGTEAWVDTAANVNTDSYRIKFDGESTYSTAMVAT